MGGGEERTKENVGRSKDVSGVKRQDEAAGRESVREGNF